MTRPDFDHCNHCGVVDVVVACRTTYNGLIYLCIPCSNNEHVLLVECVDHVLSRNESF